MLQAAKRIALLLAVGAALGDIVTMLMAPSFVTWFQTPAVGSALCNCADVSRDTAEALVRAQLIGTAVGALSLAVVGEVAWRLWDARRRRNLLALITVPSSPAGPNDAPRS